MTTPKSETQITINARFTKQMVDRMDLLIKKGEFTSRSVLIKTAVNNLLNEGRAREEADRMISDALASGRYDDLIADRVRIALSEIIGAKLQNPVKQG